MPEPGMDALLSPLQTFALVEMAGAALRRGVEMEAPHHPRLCMVEQPLPDAVPLGIGRDEELFDPIAMNGQEADCQSGDHCDIDGPAPRNLVRPAERSSSRVTGDAMPVDRQADSHIDITASKSPSR